MEKPTKRTLRKEHKPLPELSPQKKSKSALALLHSTFSLCSSTVSAAILLPLHSARPPLAASASSSSRPGADNQGQPITATLTITSYHQLFPLVNSCRPLTPPASFPHLSQGGAGRGAGSAPSKRRKRRPIGRLRCRPPANGWWQR